MKLGDVNKGVTSAHLQDLNQDDKQEILAGTSDEHIFVLEEITSVEV